MTDQPYIGVIQGSQEWFDARMGHLGSSRIKDAIGKRKRGDAPLQARIDLCLDLAAERITGKPCEHYVSYWMERGTELEPMARAAYERRVDADTEQIGFILHPTIEWGGASPDGFVGTGGLAEFKCPKTNTHLEYLLGECVPEIYQPQILWQMACTGRQWCDFVSYHPDFPTPHDLFTCRLNRNEAIQKVITDMEAEAVKFLDEVAAMVKQAVGGLEGQLRESVRRTSIVSKAIIPPWQAESLGDA